MRQKEGEWQERSPWGGNTWTEVYMKVRGMGRKAYQPEELLCKTLEVRMLYSLVEHNERQCGWDRKQAARLWDVRLESAMDWVFVLLPKILTLKFNGQCGKSRGGAAELIRSQWRGTLSEWDWCLTKRLQRALSTLCHLRTWGYREKMPSLWTRKWALTRHTKSSSTFILNFLVSRTVLISFKLKSEGCGGCCVNFKVQQSNLLSTCIFHISYYFPLCFITVYWI